MKHGTTTAYKNHGCRCDECRAAHARTAKAWRVRTGTVNHRHRPAVPDLIDATAAREHIAACLASGMSQREVEREAGLAPSHAGRILAGRHQLILRRTAARILAVEPIPDDDPDYVDHVVVDRLLNPAASWRDVGATRAERIAAAEILAARIARVETGVNGHAQPWETLSSIEARLGLRAGRDFDRPKVSAA